MYVFQDTLCVDCTIVHLISTALMFFPGRYNESTIDESGRSVSVAVASPSSVCYRGCVYHTRVVRF